MTLTSFVFTELANTMKYGRGLLYNLVSPSDVTVFHRMKYGGGGCYIALFSRGDVTAFHRIYINVNVNYISTKKCYIKLLFCYTCMSLLNK